MVVTGEDEPAGVDVLTAIGEPKLLVAGVDGKVRASA